MAQNNQTAIAVTDDSVRSMVESLSNRYIKPLYHGRDYQGFMLDAALFAIQNDEIRNAIAEPIGKAQFVRALQIAASSGLSLNPQKGESTLVVYKKSVKKGNDWVKEPQITFMPMKNGVVKIAMRTKKVLKVESGTIFVNDIFSVKKGSDGDKYEWTPALNDRGDSIAYFAAIKLDDGTSSVEYWTKSQVQEWALKYGNGKEWDDKAKKYLDKFKPDSAWGKSFDGQAEKTVIKAALRGLYLPELEEFLEEPAESETVPAEDQHTTLADEIKAAAVSGTEPDTAETPADMAAEAAGEPELEIF
ncbi:hypothetical protein FACS1894110_10100 [Spirochaetia bacterium]|nr:hypothetical protein FACS1894110_10100 [Spirochaetia bacterium]